MFKWLDRRVAAQVGVVGLGLLGGSLLRRLAATASGGIRGIGWDTDADTRERAGAAGLAVSASLEELAANSDVLFVAVPLPELSIVFTAISGVADPAMIVTDLTSVKQPVRDLAGAYGFAFVGGHPMAGTEESGFTASTPALLADATWVLTLDEETDMAAWLTVAALVTSLGCRVIPCTSPEHDRAVARVSHLPHVVAAALTLGAAGDPLPLSLAAGSFRDATRVAATRAELVAAMCGGNAASLDAELTAFANRLRESRPALYEPERLTAWFSAAEAVRKVWPPVADVQTELAVDGQLPEHLLVAGRAGGHVTAVTAEQVVIRTPMP